MKTFYDMDRRRFLKTGIVMGTGLVLGTHLVSGRRAMAGDSQTGVLRKSSEQAREANLFVALLPDGTVEITCHRSDMGQQIRTAVAQIVADEMEADWDRVRVIQAQGDPAYGDQNTDGSRSIRYNFDRLREMGASARFMLEQAAANRWKVDRSTCRASLHEVKHTSGKSLPFADLVKDATSLEPPKADQVKLKKRSDWRYIGKGKPSIDLHNIVHGEAAFAADVREPKARVAVIERPDVVFSKVASFNKKAAMKVPGVVEVVKLPDPVAPAKFLPKGGVAVIAENTWAALQGKKALDVKWDLSGNKAYDSKDFKKELFKSVESADITVREKGNAKQTLKKAARKHQADYYVPHLSQAPMEPPCATASFKDGSVEIWAATQNPQADMSTVAEYLGIEKEKVTCNVTLLGGAFGRKSKPDFSAEAAFLSREIGQPVRVQWTREDDIKHGYFHTVSAQRLEASLDKKGAIEAFRHRTVFPPIASTFTEGATKPMGIELDLGFRDSPIYAPHLLLQHGEAKAMTRIGWMRSVSNIFHAFAVQSFLAELADKAGQDPKDFLLAAIGPDRKIDFAAQNADYSNYSSPIEEYPFDTGRLRHVTERAASMADWGRKLPKGHGLGIAAHRSFVSYVATVVEVSTVDDGEFAIENAWVVIDAGTVVNKDTVVNQCEGGSIYGLSCALGKITFKDGAAEQTNFHNYKGASIGDAPAKIPVEVVESDAPPAG
ncbi:MAG: molybdopterin cofactor-binding domain-containing protein, partial [Ketobacteraceae bacterium]|nr:molybdopterin cofactor-binding domain-containing protein [Ketobacteraceae bacterium]